MLQKTTTPSRDQILEDDDLNCSALCNLPVLSLRQLVLGLRQLPVLGLRQLTRVCKLGTLYEGLDADRVTSNNSISLSWRPYNNALTCLGFEPEQIHYVHMPP
ncbi:uncharacterized protein LACBIDRAFT_333578 [Laccaria bicolor S238N-H82]|uniref:Predicted protein n=1 Tax=Laccaria bicolor (strain S238N-H82 / ATCC MYA-4686) TaxID=486041 RepID=B0DWD6_LACBS|nr:uncharacterized protein LACBIDRAFT_333578 [Laccaria bicolor S238N-H82]EDR01069.1 predicted protein [Laccaria bicolor S238N-H82]|eukprot:XP_001888288.1 predicted protein [Laccaria bicolor S238N-H82]